MFFWRETGYFAPTAETQPLLHMWSLSVEEQFYVVFPLFLLLLTRLSRPSMIASVVAICVCSMVIAQWGAVNNPNAAFYLLPTRAWELGIGGLLAIGAIPELRSAIARNVVSVAGLVAVLAAILLFTARTPFPGLSAALPVFGAVALIYCGPEAIINRALAWPPLVGVGLISYSLYLWHWPIIVFLRQYSAQTDLPSTLIVVAVALSLTAATLTCLLIERPFRNRSKVTKRGIFVGSGIATMLLATLAILIDLQAGLPSRFSLDVQRTAAATKDFSKLGKMCLGQGGVSEACQFGSSNGPVIFAIWGDSFAAAMVPAFQFASERSEQRGVLAAMNTCPPLDGVVTTRLVARDQERCRRNNAKILTALTNSPSITTVVLTANWSYYLSKAGEPMMVGGARAPDKQAALGAGLQRSISSLEGAGKRVVILYDLPTPGFDVPWQLALAATFRSHVPNIDVPAETDMDHLLTTIKGGERYKLSPAVCDTVRCYPEINGTVVYTDGGHVSATAAETLFGPPLSAILFRN